VLKQHLAADGIETAGLFLFTPDNVHGAQAGFFKGICMPLFDALALYLALFEPTAARVRANGADWAREAAQA